MSFILLNATAQNGNQSPAVDGWSVGYHITPTADVTVSELGAFSDLATRSTWVHDKQVRIYRVSDSALIASADVARSNVGATARYVDAVVLKTITPVTLVSGVKYLIQTSVYASEPMLAGPTAAEYGTPDLGGGLITFPETGSYYSASGPAAMATTNGAPGYSHGYFGPTMTCEEAIGGGGTTVKIGFIGTSITAGTVLGSPSTQAPPVKEGAYLEAQTSGLTATIINNGQSGSTSADWVPGGSYLTAAKSAFASSSVEYVSVEIGMNDAKTGIATSVPTYKARLAAICADLVSAGYKVVLNYTSYPTPGAFGQWGSNSPTLVQGYNLALSQLVDGLNILQGDETAYAYFRDNPGAMSDGIHPTTSGSDTLGQLWGAAFNATPSAPTAVPGPSDVASGVIYLDSAGNVHTGTATGGGGGGGSGINGSEILGIL